VITFAAEASSLAMEIAKCGALVFFGLFGGWTSRLFAAALAIIALPWAVLTSALEWFFLVPVFPFAQPIFTLQQPYWIGLLAAAISGCGSWRMASGMSSSAKSR
jgi:hypothetical protein